jgi:hypothetical protein
LSIDEIWSENQLPANETTPAEREEETIVFDHPNDDQKLPLTDKAFPGEPTTVAPASLRKESALPLTGTDAPHHDPAASSPSSTEYEMVGDEQSDTDLAEGLDDGEAAAVDYELDELEAEIARELED